MPLPDPTAMTKRTPFYEVHAQLGAKIIPFAGYEMPVQYPSGIVQEHLAVRTAVGVFDVSHMGEFEVRGPGAQAFVSRMTTNDPAKLSPGRVQYSVLCYDNGGIVDDLLVYNRGSSYLLVVNASNIEKDFAWLKDHVSPDVELRDISESISLLAVQGPKSLETLEKICPLDLGSLKYYHATDTEVAGIPALVSRTGYTGELGFELYFKADPAIGRRMWDALFEAGKPFGIVPVGLGARDTLRLEMGYCLYGNDIDQTTNPLEAGLGWVTKLDKAEFVGQKALRAVKANGLQRSLVGFVLPEKALARHGYTLRRGGVDVGHVTSGTFSPSLKAGIAMGYVGVEHAAPGTVLEVDIRVRSVEAAVVGLPFVAKH
jgi:aminomethyltransferase